MAFNADLLSLQTHSIADQYFVVEELLVEVRTQIEARYNQRILMIILTTSQRNATEQEILRRYSVELNFVDRDHYTYRLMELTCHLDQEFAVEVVAPHTSRKKMGTAHSLADVESLVNEVFSDATTRNTILVNYKL